LKKFPRNLEIYVQKSIRQQSLYMLPRKYSISKKKDFENIFTNGKSFFTKIIGAKYIKNDLATPRFAIVISTKISKKATVRNKIKRRIKEILHLNMQKIKNCDIIILTRNSIIDNYEYKELKNNIEYILTKARLIKK